MADMLSKFLLSSSFVATSIHGDCTQREREMAVQTFHQGCTPILVATTVAARGLDILNVTHVINYGLSSDIDDHVYRIGHTGRAGNTEILTAFFNQRVTTTSLVVDTVALVDDQPVMVDMAAATLEVEVPTTGGKYCAKSSTGTVPSALPTWPTRGACASPPSPPPNSWRACNEIHTQARGARHAHKRARPDPRGRAQDVDQPRPDSLHPDCDREFAIAQLALKHRQNKTLCQRVVVFVGPPLEDISPDAERVLVRLAKKLKKKNVALNVIAFGDGIEEAGEGGHSILHTFVETASSSDNSYIPCLFFF